MQLQGLRLAGQHRANPASALARQPGPASLRLQRFALPQQRARGLSYPARYPSKRVRLGAAEAKPQGAPVDAAEALDTHKTLRVHYRRRDKRYEVRCALEAAYSSLRTSAQRQRALRTAISDTHSL